MNKTEMMALADLARELQDAALRGIDHVGRLNDAGREHEAKQWVRRKFDALEAALRLAAGASAGGAVKVRHLDWGEPYLNEIKETAVSAHSSCGRYIASDHGWFLCGLTQWNEAADIEAAKAAAQAEYESRILSALTPEPVKAGEVVAVRPLEWHENLKQGDREGFVCSEGGVLSYSIMLSKFRVYGVAGDHDGAAEFGSLEAAKAAAQAEYESRILSALIPEPAKAGDAVLRPRPSDCANPLMCGWHHVSTDPEINMWLCSQPGCSHMPTAISTTAPQPDNGARGNQSDDGVTAADELEYKFSCVLGHATGGKLSYTSYPKETMYDAVNEHIANCCQQTIDDYKEEHASDTAPAEPVAWQVLIKLEWITLPSDWSISERVEGQTYRPLYAHPPRSVDVEAIERVIDPQAWRDREYYDDYRRLPASEHHATKSSLAKARSIAAMIEGLPPHPIAPAAPVSVDEVAKAIWYAGFKRAFDREPSDPWENQGDAVKRPHLNTARALRDAFKMERK